MFRRSGDRFADIGEPSGLAFGKPKGELRDAVL